MCIIFLKVKKPRNFEIKFAYTIREDKIIVVIMAGTHENFYDELKRYMKG